MSILGARELVDETGHTGHVPPTAASDSRVCAVCGEVPREGNKLKVCARCHDRTRRYCGTACQRKDWLTHKHSCKAPSKASVPDTSPPADRQPPKAAAPPPSPPLKAAAPPPWPPPKAAAPPPTAPRKAAAPPPSPPPAARARRPRARASASHAAATQTARLTRIDQRCDRLFHLIYAANTPSALIVAAARDLLELLSKVSTVPVADVRRARLLLTKPDAPLQAVLRQLASLLCNAELHGAGAEMYHTCADCIKDGDPEAGRQLYDLQEEMNTSWPPEQPSPYVGVEIHCLERAVKCLRAAGADTPVARVFLRGCEANLAVCLQRENRLEEAVKLQQEITRNQLAEFGPGTPEVLRSQSDLQGYYRNIGDYEAVVGESLAMVEHLDALQQLGRREWCRAVHNACEAMLALGRHREALPYCRRFAAFSEADKSYLKHTLLMWDQYDRVLFGKCLALVARDHVDARRPKEALKTLSKLEQLYQADVRASRDARALYKDVCRQHAQCLLDLGGHEEEAAAVLKRVQ